MFNNSGSRRIDLPPVTKNIIIINALIWLAMMLFPQIANFANSYLGLHYFESSDFQLWQVVSYMFVHDKSNIFHIFFNMFTLWMFGRILEQVWGSKRFILFYMVCGIGAAIIQEAVWALTYMHDYTSEIAKLNGLTYDTMKSIIDLKLAAGDPGFQQGIEMFKSSLVTIGASGAIFGLLLGFAFIFPNIPMYIMFIPVPVKAKYMVLGYALIELFFGVASLQNSVAHFAHLGGMIFGLILLLYWKKKGMLNGGYFF